MTTINELFPPEIADGIHKGLDIIEQKEALEAKKKVAMDAKKKERDAAYRKIVFGHIPSLLHKFVLPFYYRFDKDPTGPEPSDIFDVEIPGLPMFSFKIGFGLVRYYLPVVNLFCMDGLENRRREFLGDISLVLAELFEIKRKADYELGKQPETEPAYVPFEDDGPNADPDVDEVSEEKKVFKVITGVDYAHGGDQSVTSFMIPAGHYVVNSFDLEKLVGRIVDTKLARLNIL